MYAQNESKHLDLMEWLDTLETLGLNVEDTFPAVAAANARVDRLTQLQNHHVKTRRDANTVARQIGLTEDLDDAEAILTTADHFAYSQSDEHRQIVGDLLEGAADIAKGEALRRFRRSNPLEALRPIFEPLAARIVEAADIIPEGVINLDDAARLGHADTYLQLERDVRAWNDIADLLGDWREAGILDTAHYPIEYMVEDPEAARETTAGLNRPTRRALGIRAGRPHLHIPEASPLAPLEPREQEWAARDANEADRAAREHLGLTRTAQ